MLSSIILSMALSVTPATNATTDSHSLATKNINVIHETFRLSAEKNLDTQKTGWKRGTRRLSAEKNLDTQKTGWKRGTRRL